MGVSIFSFGLLFLAQFLLLKYPVFWFWFLMQLSLFPPLAFGFQLFVIRRAFFLGGGGGVRYLLALFLASYIHLG